MIRRRSFSAAWLAIVAMSGCATPQNLIHPVQGNSELRPSPGNSLVVIIRESMLKGSIGTWAVHLDGREVAHLGTTNHVVIEMTPGEHFLGGPMVQPQPITLKANDVYYFSYDIPFLSGLAFEAIPEAKARALLLKSTRVKIYGPSQ
jgi:hypothetical protein